MATKPLENIIKKSKQNHKADIENRKGWSVENVLSCEYFDDKADKEKIHNTMHKRGSGKLFDRYIDKIKDNIFILEARYQKYKELYDDYYPNICRCESKDSKGNYQIGYMLPRQANLYISYLAEMEELKISEMMDDIKSELEVIRVILAFKMFKELIKKAPTKTNDSNASRKGMITRQAYLKDIRIDIEKLMTDTISNNSQTQKGISQRQSKLLTSKLITLITNL